MIGHFVQILFAQPLEDITLYLSKVVRNEKSEQRIVLRVDSSRYCDGLRHNYKRVQQCILQSRLTHKSSITSKIGATLTTNSIMLRPTLV